ncbi:c-type cytochrome [bacterium]|nr:c-type cytochrome [bacterium]
MRPVSARLALTAIFLTFAVVLPGFAGGETKEGSGSSNANNSPGEAALSRGKVVFETHLCVECHKDGGNSVRPSKPISGKKFLKKYPEDSQIESVIRNGVPNASMPSFGPAVITEEEMKDLLCYVRSLTRSDPETSENEKKKQARPAVRSAGKKAGKKKK